MKDRSPAFPLPGYVNMHDPCAGMNLRDFFAANAANAIIKNSDIKNAEYIAVFAYQIADAMMEARDV